MALEVFSNFTNVFALMPGFFAPYQQLLAPRGEWQPTPPRYAEVDWHDGVPVSRHFDDVYYSKAGGLAEVEQVFMAGCGLPEAWQRHRSFCLGELGFGTGLSFLTVCRSWLAESQAAAELHFLSFEQYPLSKNDLQMIYQQWPELAELAATMIERMPLAVAGVHRIDFPEWRVKLTLVLGDAAEFLPLIQASVDAWFLDGFAPAKNPEFWTSTICAEVARLSCEGARLASFSCARVVRDVLSDVGFELEKHPGFGGKREMLRGVFRRSRAGGKSPERGIDVSMVSPPDKQRTVAVVGAGLAGCSLAYHFAKRGWQVELIEQEQAAAQHASGNRAAVLMAYLSAKPDYLSRFYIAGYLYTLRLLAQLDAASDPAIFDPCGVLRLTSSKRLASVLQRLPEQCLPEELVCGLDAQQVSSVCGIPINSEALYFSKGGWLDPRALCERLLQRASSFCSTAQSVQRRFGRKLHRLERTVDAHWNLLDVAGQTITSAEVVVLASGYQACSLPECSWLPLEKVRGQVQFLPECNSLQSLQTVLCYDGYLIPGVEGGYLLGATYTHQDEREEVDPSEQRQLIERLVKWSPALDAEAIPSGEGRVGFRSMSPDRLPLLGPAVAQEGFEEQYLAANDGRYGPQYPRSADIPGVYLSVGHGSRGLLSCLLGAEIIASQVCEEPMPLESDLLRAVDPCRFLVRAVKRSN